MDKPDADQGKNCGCAVIKALNDSRLVRSMGESCAVGLGIVIAVSSSVMPAGKFQAALMKKSARSIQY